MMKLIVAIITAGFICCSLHAQTSFETFASVLKDVKDNPRATSAAYRGLKRDLRYQAKLAKYEKDCITSYNGNAQGLIGYFAAKNGHYDFGNTTTNTENSPSGSAQ